MKNKIKHIIFVGTILVFAFSSCQVVNKYKSPEIDAALLFRDENPADTTTIANIPWKEYFKDSLLHDLISEGLEKNIDIQVAISRIKEADANLGIARAAYFPTLSLAAQDTYNAYSVQNGQKDVLGYSTNQFTLGVAAIWEVDLWGKLNRQSRAKYAQYLNSYTYKNLVQTSLVANIANTYYSLLAMDEQLKIMEENVELLIESVNTMQAMKESGLLNAAAVEQSKSLLFSTQVGIPDLQIRIRQTENALSALLGRKPGPISRSTLAEQTVPDEMQYGVPAQMLSKRPDVQQAELSFRTAFELTNVAQASFYPTLTLNTGSVFGYSSTDFSDFFKPENLIANVIGGLIQPLFVKKQLTGNLKIAKAQQEQALINFQQTVLDAGREVSDILYGYQSSISKNSIRSKQIESTKTSVYYTQELLKAGEANYTEVINAESNNLQAQLGQVNDKLEQLNYTVNLYRALGGGVE